MRVRLGTASVFFFFSSRRRHTRCSRDWSSDVCSSDLNNRDGTFRDVTAEPGLNRNNTRYSFCCGWSDYTRDGWPDLYVVNDFGRKNLYRNNGDGTFTDIAPQAGVEDVGAGMSVCWFDYDNDGAEDLYVADMWSAAGERVSMQAIFQKNAPETVRALYRKHAMGNSL